MRSTRTVIAVVLVGFVGGCGLPGNGPSAQDNEAALKVGDPAPPLTVDKWIQGAEVRSFVPGQVYVIEFWATWCGPCIKEMSHLDEYQAKYKNEGVTIIGFTPDMFNSADEVTAFLGQKHPRPGYTFAHETGRVTYDAYMKAAGQSGVPCSFVVDRAGRIAYIGHPTYLDDVLPKVVAGTR
ncbi:TlpA family protein disulfide reductase [Fimbriiglobus ruber]|uniref:Thioredoxin family protein n=1 Tax=Fimbriiglobus ruber TaxID=1908690 RepID=A0A225D4F4_9BACT|nr:TlpA disulfide reductase family protein [Fimbriiglobus ruber]OWK34524.1 Thioredoxin family protein [Fimbriiglobus ruber]